MNPYKPLFRTLPRLAVGLAMVGLLIVNLLPLLPSGVLPLAFSAEKPETLPVVSAQTTFATPFRLGAEFTVLYEDGTKSDLMILMPSGYDDRAVLLSVGTKLKKYYLTLIGSPVPNPTPTPTDRTLWITVIEETSQRTPAQATVINSQAVADLVKSKGHHWRAIDKDVKDERGQTPSDLAGYLQRSAGKLPYVVITDSTPKILFEGPLPATDQALVELVKKHGG